jgi:lipopolysaccharide/colanic/teichoic acid biosynthesis glycosyltransferase
MRGLQHFRLSQRTQGTADGLWRLTNIAIASILLAITLPLMIIVALAIKLESAGPVFERQCCIGRGGRRFQMLKFRTAVHNPHQAIPPWAQVPTPVGQFLWRTRIEALPQLINVLRNEMSIIDRAGGLRFLLD